MGLTPNPKSLEKLHPDKELSEETNCRNMELFRLEKASKIKDQPFTQGHH